MIIQKKVILPLIILLLLMCIITIRFFYISIQSANYKPPELLEIHFIDVDAPSDAIFIKLPEGKHMLIDCGHGGIEGEIVKSYLNKQNIKTLDYVFGTHSHADHIGGMTDIISSYNIGKYYQPPELTDSSTTLAVKKALKTKGMSVTIPVAGTDIFNINNGELRLTLLAPNRLFYEDENDYSLVLKLVYKNNSFLFTGDASIASEEDMIIKKHDLSANLLKVGHHGSNTSTSDKFLSAVSPTYAVITSDVDRRKGEGKAKTPTKVVLDKLYARKVKVYRVGEQGTIVCTSDGKNISFNKKDVTLNDYSYGSHLPENNLPDRDYIVSNNNYRVVMETKSFSKFEENWTVTKSGSGVQYEIASEGSNKFLKLTRDTGKKTKLECQRRLKYPLFGNIQVKADIRLTNNPNPETNNSLIYIMQEDGNNLIFAEFNSHKMYLRNLGAIGYPGTEVKINLPQDQWFNVCFNINTRTAKFDVFIDNELVNSSKINLLNVLDDANVGSIAFAVTTDKTTFCIDNVSVGVEDYVFEETFETGTLDQWDEHNNSIITGKYAFWGNNAAELTHNTSIIKNLNTENKKEIAIDFTWVTRNLSADDYLISEWYDGLIWHEVSRIGSDVTKYRSETNYLPAKADNNPNFKFRFRLSGSKASENNESSGYGYVDNVFIRAIPIN